MQQKINLTQVICLRIGKTTEAKPYQMNLKVTTPENPLLSPQVITCKMNHST